MSRSAPFRAAVSAVIPTYNGATLLERYLPATFAALRSGDELIIIDDASKDNTWDWLLERFSVSPDTAVDLPDIIAYRGDLSWKQKKIQVVLLKNIVNQRFAETCNRAVKCAKNSLVFLLNSDVSPSPDILEHLLPFFADKSVFGVGCLEHELPPGAPSSQKPVIGGKNSLWVQRGMFHHARAQEFTTGETAWVSGGSGLFDRQKWLELGGFDLCYRPAYWEDIDLSHRARLKGWKVMFCAEAVVHHYHETTNKDVFGESRIQAMSWQNMNVFMAHHGTLSQKIAHFFWQPFWWWKRGEWWYFAAIAVLILGFMLRFHRLGEVPHGMTWDEAAIGYNGYAIFTTRRDEWLERLPVSFRSFGDYKAPLAIYLNGISTALFGMTLWAVRFPFAVAGVVGVAAMMWLGWLMGRWLFPHREPGDHRPFLLGLLAGGMTAFSPWHLHFSRVGFESGMAMTWVVLGMCMLFTAVHADQPAVQAHQPEPSFVPWHWPKWGHWLVNCFWFWGGGVCLVASIYTYHSAKIFVPLLMLAFGVSWWRQLWHAKYKVMLATFASGILMWPLVKDTLWGHGGTRFLQASIFGEHGLTRETFSQLIQHFAAHFSLSYLFQGETISLRHGDAHWGVLYPSVFVFVILGVLFSLSSLRTAWQSLRTKGAVALGKQREGLFLFWCLYWVLAGTLPAAIGKDVPHSNRALLALPGFLMLASVGVLQLQRWAARSSLNNMVRGSKKEQLLFAKSIVGVALIGYFMFVLAYVRDYYQDFAARSTADFADGYLEAMHIAHRAEKQVDKVLFTNKYGQAYIYALFARKTNPIWYQGGSLIKYEFSDKVSVADIARPNTLVVATPEELPLNLVPRELPVDQVFGADGKLRFVIVQTPAEPERRALPVRISDSGESK